MKRLICKLFGHTATLESDYIARRVTFTCTRCGTEVDVPIHFGHCGIVTYKAPDGWKW